MVNFKCHPNIFVIFLGKKWIFYICILWFLFYFFFFLKKKIKKEKKKMYLATWQIPNQQSATLTKIHVAYNWQRGL
jgi:hypothetical protein